MLKILRLQIGLRWFLAAVLTIGVVAGLIGKRYVDQWRAEYPLKHQKEIAERLQAAGAKVEVTGAGWIHSIACSTAWPCDRNGKEEYHWLAEMPRLRALHLTLSTFGDDDAVHLKGLSQLVHLDLDRTNITDRSAPVIGELKKLIFLSAADTQIGDGAIPHFQALRELRDLYLPDTSITNEGVREISKMTWLTDLNLAETRIDDRALPYLSQMPELYYLKLQGTDVRGPGLAALKTKQPLILYLSRLSLDDASGLAELNLRSLYLEDCQVTSETLRYAAAAKCRFAGAATNLAVLDLSGATLDDDALRTIAHLNQFRRLNLRATGITDDKLALLRGIEGTIDLQENPVTEAGVRDFLRHSPNARVTFADNHVMDATGTLTTGYGRRGPPRPRGKYGTLTP